MTLLNAILRKVQSQDSIKKYASPPPEIEKIVLPRKKRQVANKYDYVRASVDSSSPAFDEVRMYRSLPEWRTNVQDTYLWNARLLMAIRNAHLTGGKVDSRWTKPPEPCTYFYQNRVNRYKLIVRENKDMYKRITTTKPRVVTTASLLRDWEFNKQEIIQIAQSRFTLFPVSPREHIEDKAFLAPEGVTRPRVNITLRTVRASVLGTLTVELFTDVCPATCRLFLELVDGDTGYGYVGTRFFRKVPHLYWSGGDVVYDNGFGCYAQRGRSRPIGAENYHFPHSIPGLLSMRMTRDDEMCGIFNITFKPLPQLDLRNVVFGRVIRPSSTYDVIQTLGSPLSTQPHIEIVSTRRRSEDRWLHGKRNTKLVTLRT